MRGINRSKSNTCLHEINICKGICLKNLFKVTHSFKELFFLVKT